MKKVSTFQQRLREIMLEKSISQAELLRLLMPLEEKFGVKIGKTNLSYYYNGINEPKNARLTILAEALGVSSFWLEGYQVDKYITPKKEDIWKIFDEKYNSKQMAKDLKYADDRYPNSKEQNLFLGLQGNFDKLNLENKEKLVGYSSKLVYEEKKEEYLIYPINVIEKVSAGTGYSYGDNETTPYYTDRQDLKRYDFATLVNGDSMYPKYNDGDVLLIRKGYDNVNGDIYVIDYDGESYVKKLYNEGTRFVLKSINEKYDDIIIYISDIKDSYFNIVGKVVDSFTPVNPNLYDEY